MVTVTIVTKCCFILYILNLNLQKPFAGFAFLGFLPPPHFLGFPLFNLPLPPWPQGAAASLTQCCQNVVSSTCFRNYHSSWKVFSFFKIIIDFIILLKGSIMSGVVHSVTKDGLNRGAHSTIFPDPIPSNPMNPSHFQHQSAYPSEMPFI